MKLTYKIIVFVIVLLLLMFSFNKGDIYYLSVIDTYVIVQKSHKGCYISFEKNKVNKFLIKKEDYILVPNISNLYILYDSVNKNVLHISCSEEFNTTNAFKEYKNIKYNFDLYPYNKTDLFFKNFYDEKKKIINNHIN